MPRSRSKFLVLIKTINTFNNKKWMIIQIRKYLDWTKYLIGKQNEEKEGDEEREKNKWS